MTYQQAGRIAVLKRIAGWVIFIPAVISTLISVLKFMYDHSEKQPGINAVMLDFAHVMIEMMRFNTPFLNVFWFNSPTPDFQHQLNIGFWVIYALIFVALALQEQHAGRRHRAEVDQRAPMRRKPRRQARQLRRADAGAGGAAALCGHHRARRGQ